MENSKKEIDVLLEFLSMPINSDEQVFEKFKSLNGLMRKGNERFEQFLYVKGTRKNKVLLVAHADTYWDKKWSDHGDFINAKSEYEREDDIIRSISDSYGIGADDRAGCAILWLLKDLGHSLLITTGEEHGQIASNWIMNSPENNDIRDEIQNEHQFVIQLDRRNGTDYKCYNVGSDKFREYVNDMTKYTEPDRSSRTDIVILCDKITGVNLSIGYCNEHKKTEYINIREWLHTYDMLRNWITRDDLPRFER